MKMQKANRPQQIQINGLINSNINTADIKEFENNIKFKEIDKINEYLYELKLLKKLRSDAKSKKIPVIDNKTGSFLEIICLLSKPEKILEVGCGTGYSTYFLLKHFRKIIEKTEIGEKTTDNCPKSFKKVDNESSIHTSNIIYSYKYSYTGIDLNKDRLSEAKNFIYKIYPDLEMCKSLELNFIGGNAVKIIPGLRDKFDLVFIDAAKFEYPDYLRALKGKLKSGCLVIADNIFYCGKIFGKKISRHDYNSIKGLREYVILITDSSEFETNFFNTGDGIAVSKYTDKCLKP